ncbi:hypothetical protein LTR91_014504 [Friedmanniomyces endolithicus]|uniref:RING-type domain-containing protein n=1 Tax=Friedmanniomyces endolithicus TaxID=329885 RepID=A0AAN6QN06_9PEZI|nr:hypothetical protein LTR94_003961 [Friedmanniomyces endolithicus]KAK0788519.1 hypothetical protein LTR38_011249 [Friedmanniomyces endolithicus]KAK0814241.1 hypothetical protein LTR59_000778 [Friedmanniomyces endolithicus]KAK0845525.1 hypothetical protein LTR03_007415 [Friedmanniomyces endolithicus]KAK0872856.1 hypothetical protein LTS02_001138 [Friedmanniomyces endolithicus]
MSETASIFDFHHITTIHYPSLRDLHNSTEELALATPVDCTERYDPNLPLVADTAVRRNAGRMNDAETSFYSLTPAVSNPSTRRASDDLAADERLLYDMQRAISGVGGTELFVVTFDVPRPARIEGDKHADDNHTGSRLGERRGDGDHASLESHSREAMIRMNRQTTLPPVKQESGDYLAEIGSGEYTMTTAAFDAMESDALWLENMRDLIHGRSDRAVKHVALQLERQERENPPVAWKAARQPLYFCIEVLEISRPVDAEALACKPDVEDRYCSICREDYGPKAEPLALHNSSHLVCEPCLVTWCLKQGPGVRCPHVVLRTWFNFGAKGKTYAYDDRYNEWENYTRSIADLDEHLAKNNSTWITIHRDAALSIWDDIVTHDLLETPSSTPYHLQPARSIHYAFLRSSIESSLNTRTGLHYPTSTAYEILLAEFRRRLSLECVRTGEMLGSTRRQRRVTLQEPGGVGIVNGPSGFWEYGLAPGFMEFAKRTLSRTLQFLSLRVCHCSERGEGGFHLHGLRK